MSSRPANVRGRYRVPGLGCSKQGYNLRVSAKFQFSYENFKSKFSFIFFYTIWWFYALKRIEKIILKNAFEQKKTWVKI